MDEKNPILQFVMEHPWLKVDLKYSEAYNSIRIGLSGEEASIAYKVDKDLVCNNPEFLEFALHELEDRLRPLGCFPANQARR